jgi:hypothetical protein
MGALAFLHPWRGRHSSSRRSQGVYFHLTELRFRSLDRCSCREMTPEDHAMLQALNAAHNAERDQWDRQQGGNT